MNSCAFKYLVSKKLEAANAISGMMIGHKPQHKLHQTFGISNELMSLPEFDLTRMCTMRFVLWLPLPAWSDIANGQLNEYSEPVMPAGSVSRPPPGTYKFSGKPIAYSSNTACM